MCFHNDDCDWAAEVHEELHVKSDVACKCCECHREILPGQWRREIRQQEHDSCQYCEDECSDVFIDPDLAEDDPVWRQQLQQELNDHNCDYGETFSASICRECCLLLEAIYNLEEKENCPEDARQPLIGMLADEIGDDRDDVYIKHAVAMFPELATHSLCQLIDA